MILFLLINSALPALYTRNTALPVPLWSDTTTTAAWRGSSHIWQATTSCSQCSGFKWSYSSISSNKLAQIINGNRRMGYNLAMWNCRRGLLNSDNNASSKMTKVTDFISKYKIHMLCLIESDLHSAVSRYRRTQPLTKKSILDKLSIPGYNIYLPATWDKHGQA